MNERSTRPPLVGVGAGAGGFEALRAFLDVAPHDRGIAYVVMRRADQLEWPSAFADGLLPCIEVNGDAELRPNHVHVVPSGVGVTLGGSLLSTTPSREPHLERVGIDLLFRALAGAEDRPLAIILSGDDAQGTLGARAIKDAGGIVLVQEPAETAHDAMPRAAISAGVSDWVLPVPKLAERLPELLQPCIAEPAHDEQRCDPREQEALDAILALVRLRTGQDFSLYKRNPVMRRIARRMQLHRTTTLADYLQILEADPDEVAALFKDMLISVTTFFRDPQAWETLRREAIAKLVREDASDGPLRAWVPGCATGEEAYTLTMLFEEEIERQGRHRDVIVFASDVDEAALLRARRATYPPAICADVSPQRLRRFFRQHNGEYIVADEIRESVVFSVHGLLRDPPFSRLHLISCRNLLIYLDREPQEHAQQLFHYACRPRGYLFLGASENADEQLFETIDNKSRLFQARDLMVRPHPRFSSVRTSIPRRVRDSGALLSPSGAVDAPHLHGEMLERFAPPSMLVDESWNVAHLSRTVGRFLQQRGGPPSANAGQLVRPELQLELRSALQRAFTHAESYLSPFVSLEIDGETRRVALLCQPRAVSGSEQRLALVVFLEAGVVPHEHGLAEDEAPTHELIASLRERLREADRRIAAHQDDRHLVSEDLLAANEELQSLNEEYRATTEELETSREELQSVNEELQTVNAELAAKLEEISRAHSDLENLMAATDIATLFLDRGFRIQRFTPRLTELFNVETGDRGRHIGDFTHRLRYSGLIEDAGQVLARLTPLERSVRSATGQAFLVRLRPYRTVEGRVDGVVITFFDVTAQKNAEEALQASERRLAAELQAMRRLHETTMSVASAGSMEQALRVILDAAIELHGAEFGSIQLLKGSPEDLEFAAQRGLPGVYLEALEAVTSDHGSASGRALRARRRCLVEDVTKDPVYAPYRKLAAQAGYRAVHAAPLISGNDELLGVLTVYFRRPSVFGERDKQLSDLLSRAAAELIAQRTREAELARLAEALKLRTEDLEDSERQLQRQAGELMVQDRRKAEFLAVLSHELRNPLGAVRNSLELLLALVDEHDPRRAKERRALAILDRQSRHITRLVNDLLDITRIDRGKLTLQMRPTPLAESLEEVVSAIQARIEAKRLELALELPDEPLHLQADPDRLVQILENLLANAITYTDPGGRVRIEATRRGEEAVVEVSDTGIGMNPAEIESLFDPYRQASTDGAGGLGLGLTLVKALVEQHGGSVEAHSEGRGKGSRFTVALPLTRPEGETLEDPAEATVRHRILVVDDQHDVADAFAALLRSLGQEVEVAYGGEQALQTARRFRPALAFVDLSMPGMDGRELAMRLRQTPALIPLTLVALTGHGEGHAGAHQPPFDRYLLKPADAKAIVQLLESL